MGKFIDLTGQRFGKLTVVRRVENGNYKQVRWLCRCDCGKDHIASTPCLRQGKVKSCGCYNVESHTTHGESHGNNGDRTRLYKIWDGIKYRCNARSGAPYRDYSSRGIKICDEWLNSYESFRDWAMSHGYSDELSIDRIDVNGNYEPSNCRWITMKEQQRNKRCTHWITYKGETRSLPEWAEMFGLNQNKLRNRIYAGWTDPKEILFGRPRKRGIIYG